MAERIADNADLAVDELKRRARRRLVGAIVLALAAAVILPLLLEREPKPLGDDVSVQIPPVDEGKFINRLTGRTGDSKAGMKAGTKSEPKTAATKIDANPAADAASAPIAATGAAPSPVASDATPATMPAATNVSPPKKSLVEAEQKVLSPNAKAVPKSDTKAAPAPAVAAAPAAMPAPAPAAIPAPAPAKPEGFAVQIAAFTDDKGANALAARLKKAGYASTYIEPVETSRGTLWRVRVGGYPARPDAEAARVKLKADGWNGLVVTAK